MKIKSPYSEEAVEHGLACFYLEDSPFSLNIRLVREINPQIDVTPAHKAPAYVSGLVNLRGQIVTVIDLGERLGVGARKIGPESRLVILKTNAELHAMDDCELESCDDKLGLLVDRISDVVNPQEDQLEPPPPNLGGVSAAFLVGVCKTESETMGILDVKSLLRREVDSVETEVSAPSQAGV